MSEEAEKISNYASDAIEKGNDLLRSKFGERFERIIEQRTNVQANYTSFVFNEPEPVDVAKTIEITNAYFAKATITKEYEDGSQTYTVKSGDNISAIASANGTTVQAIIDANESINEQNKGNIQVGQQILISGRTEKGENITFEKISTGSVGQEVYIIIETKRYQNGSLNINVKQGKAEGIEAIDQPIHVTLNDARIMEIETTVGNLNETKYLNKTIHANKAAVKIKLDPHNDDELKDWNTKLQALEGKKTNLYLLVQAKPANADVEIIYHGRNPGADGKPDPDSYSNRWLDMDGKWFELKACLCCGFVVDSDGFITHDEITKEQVTDLEQGSFSDPLNDIEYVVLHRTVTSTARSTIDNGFSVARGGTHYGTHFLVGTDGTIYQTASLNKYTYHVKGHNSSSIGIEVVGMPLDSDGNTTVGPPGGNEVASWEALTDAQAESVACIANGLLKYYGLEIGALQVHEDLQSKTEGEGQTVYDAIINLIQ